VCAVENFAFGGAKTYIEHREAHAFVSDHMEWSLSGRTRASSRRSPSSPRWSTASRAWRRPWRRTPSTAR
jgi:hypothetical protein